MKLRLLLLISLVMLVGPWVLPAKVNPLVSMCLSLIGLALLQIGLIVATITRLYHAAEAHVAFVRTGIGGPRVIIDGGCNVVPHVHRVLRVSLKTVRLLLRCGESQGLISRDQQPVELNVAFHVRVEPKPEDILLAARSLGERATDPQAVEELVREFLLRGLRRAVAEIDLATARDGRMDLTGAVREAIGQELSEHGLTLKAVVIPACAEPEQANPATVSLQV